MGGEHPQYGAGSNAPTLNRVRSFGRLLAAAAFEAAHPQGRRDAPRPGAPGRQIRRRGGWAAHAREASSTRKGGAFEAPLRSTVRVIV